MRWLGERGLLADTVEFIGGNSTYGWNGITNASMYKDGVAPTLASDFVFNDASLVSGNQTGLIQTNNFTLKSMSWTGSLYAATKSSGPMAKSIQVGTAGQVGAITFTVCENVSLWGSSTTPERTLLRFNTRGNNADGTTAVQAVLNVEGNIYLGDATNPPILAFFKSEVAAVTLRILVFTTVRFTSSMWAKMFICRQVPRFSTSMSGSELMQAA